MEGGQTAQSTNGKAESGKWARMKGCEATRNQAKVRILDSLVRMPLLLPVDMDGWLPSLLL